MKEPQRCERVVLTKRAERRNMIVNWVVTPRTRRSVTVGPDVAQLKLGEEALRKVQGDRYRALLECAASALMITNADDTIAEANMRFEELTGYKREEIERKAHFGFYTLGESAESALGVILCNGSTAAPILASRGLRQ